MGAATTTLVYGLQPVDLLQFPQADFSLLLSGSFFVQAVVLVVMNVGPTHGYWAALTWCILMFFGYSWPLVISRYSQQQRQPIARKLLSEETTSAEPKQRHHGKAAVFVEKLQCTAQSL